MNWEIHHVNLPAQDVIETRKFLTEIVGLNEGKWIDFLAKRVPEYAKYSDASSN